MKRLTWLGALALSCGTPQSTPGVMSFEYTAKLTKGDCPVLPSEPAVHARLVAVECDKAAPVNNDPLVQGIDCGGTGEKKLLSTCDTLTVTTNTNSGAMTVAGDCPNVPARLVEFSLQWYVISPSLHKEILLAEQTGRLNLSGSKSQTRTIDFGASSKPLTKALSTDDDVLKNRFNCDRTGVSTCDTEATPGSVTTDVDGCSNLEELCKNSLFSAGSTADSCP